MSYFTDVKEWDELVGLGSDIRLRYRVVAEEWNELIDAVTLDFPISNPPRETLIQIADACADLVWTILGLANAYGIPFDEVWEEVKKSNMSKIDPRNGRIAKRDDGKILKPDSYCAPDIESIIDNVNIPR